MPDCPNGHGLLIESVSANGNGNDTRDWCDECDFEIVGHTLYAHNDPESHRYKHAGAAQSVTPSEEETGPNPGGMCLCRCGEKAPIATKTDRRKGHVEGQPVSFIWGHARRAPNPQ